MKPIEILLPWGDNTTPNIPKVIVTHSMAEYIDVDETTAHKMGIQPGPCHASIWLHLNRLSAHILVPPRGGLIRHRKDNQVAWHAKGHNYNTLGIEFLVEGTWNWATWVERIKEDWVTPEQFDSGQEQYREWVHAWNIMEITTHHRLSPSRRPDPGDGFPFQEFQQIL